MLVVQTTPSVILLLDNVIVFQTSLEEHAANVQGVIMVMAAHLDVCLVIVILKVLRVTNVIWPGNVSAN